MRAEQKQLVQRQRRHCRLSSWKSTREFELRQACSRLAVAEERARTHEARFLREQNYVLQQLRQFEELRREYEEACALCKKLEDSVQECWAQLKLVDKAKSFPSLPARGGMYFNGFIHVNI